MLLALVNLLTGIFDVGLNGGVAAWLGAYSYNAHIFGGISGRRGAVLIAGIVALIGVSLALLQLRAPGRRLASSAVVANIASLFVVVVLAAAGLEVGQ